MKNNEKHINKILESQVILTQIYNNYAENLLTTFDQMDKAFHLPGKKQDFLVSFDDYIQCLIHQSLDDCNCLNDESLNMVHNLVKFHDTEVSDASVSLERRRLYCDAVLNKVPNFIILCGYFDTELGDAYLNNKPTFSAYIFNFLKELIQLSYDESDFLIIREQNKLLKPIFDYYKMNKIKFNL